MKKIFKITILHKNYYLNIHQIEKELSGSVFIGLFLLKKFDIEFIEFMEEFEVTIPKLKGWNKIEEDLLHYKNSGILKRIYILIRNYIKSKFGKNGKDNNKNRK